MDMDKEKIATQVRCITLEDAMADKETLRRRFHGATLTALGHSGLKFIDHFTFACRLAVRGKMNMNFFDFFENWGILKERKYVNNLLKFYKGDESPKTIYKIYSLAMNAIYSFRPVVALQIYDRFKPTHILDPCAGWGGRALAASVFGAAYTGYDCNADLADAYAKMSEILNVELIIGDSLKIDFSKMKKFDMVMTSPPYYDLERYAHNKCYKNEDEMDQQFYFPLFDALRNRLERGGWIVLSINQKLFDRVFNILYGTPHVTFPLAAYKRTSHDTPYGELVYAWQKF